MLKGRQGQNEKAEAGALHYRQTDVRIDGGQTRHLQYERRDVPYGPVVKIHETETQEIHFETSTTHYYIKPRPFVLAVLNPRRQTLAACA